LRSNSNLSKSTLFQKETRISLVKALVNLEIGNIDLAEKCLEGILGSEKVFDITFEVVWANIIMARIMYQGRSKFDLGLDYTKKALSLAKEIKFNHFWIAFCYLAFGVRNLSNCEFNLSLKHHLKSLVIFRKIKNNWFIALALTNIGAIYSTIGDYDLALKYYQESLILFENQSIDVDLPLSNLIETALNKNDIKLAQKYFNRLENLHNQKKESIIPLLYPLSKALMLKKSPRIRDIAKAEELLNKLAKQKQFGLILLLPLILIFVTYFLLNFG